MDPNDAESDSASDSQGGKELYDEDDLKFDYFD